MYSSVLTVITALKNKNKPDLANSILEALGINYDISSDIPDQELEEALKNIMQFIPNVESSVEDPNSDIVIDLLSKEIPLTTNTINEVAAFHNITSESLTHSLLSVTQDLWFDKEKVQAEVLPWDVETKDDATNALYSVANWLDTKTNEKDKIKSLMHIANWIESSIDIESVDKSKAQVEEGLDPIYSKQGKSTGTPSLKYAPSNITDTAKKLWQDHVWPKYQNIIKNAGEASDQWRAAVHILRNSCKKRNIDLY